MVGGHKWRVKELILVPLGGLLVLVGVWAVLIYTRTDVMTGQTMHPYDSMGWVAGIAGMVCFAALLPTTRN